jgi:hypothetical protein
MAHAQKPDFVFRRKGRVHLNRRGRQFSLTTGSRGMRISGSNAGYTMFRGSVKSTGYPLNSPVSPSLPLPCVTVCHHISTELFICSKTVCLVCVLRKCTNLTVNPVFIHDLFSPLSQPPLQWARASSSRLHNHTQTHHTR